MASSVVTAIDFGAAALKVVSLRKRRDRIELLGAGTGSLDTVDQSDPDFPAELARVLERTVKREGIPLGDIVIGLSGRGSMVRYVSVPVVDPWKLSLVMGYEVEEQAGMQAADQIAYDYRILSLPDFDEGQFPILLGLAQTPVIEERLDVCRRGARKANDVDLQCLGAFNVFLRSSQSRDDALSVLLDIGANETHMTLQKGPELYFARTLSQGGKQFTARIQKSLSLLGPEAEETKRDAGCILEEEGDPEYSIYDEKQIAISQACRTEARSLANAVEGSIRFFERQFNLTDLQPTRLFLTGGGARLGGLPEALGAQLKCDAERLSFREVVEPRNAATTAVLADENAQPYAAAMGMALARLDTGFSLSLLPKAIKARREFWTRKIFAYYAAAVAVVLFVFLFLGAQRLLAYRTERNTAWEKAIEEAKVQEKALQKIEQANAHLHKEVAALKARQSSPRDLFMALHQLRKLTAPNIFYVRFATVEMPKVPERPRMRGGAVKEVEEQEAPAPVLPDMSFYDERVLKVEGYVVGVRIEKDGYRDLNALEKTLAALPHFESVNAGDFTYHPAGTESFESTVKPLYRQRYRGRGADHENAPRPGGALHFVLTLKLAPLG